MISKNVSTLFSILYLFIGFSFEENIETRIHMQMSPATLEKVDFGRSLATYQANGRLYAGAPRLNSQGGIFSCDFSFSSNSNESTTCTSISIGTGNKTTGAVMTKVKNYLLVCGNQYQISCPKLQIEQRVIGKCFTYSLSDANEQSLPSPCPIGCPRGLVADIVFVIDASGSVSTQDFQIALDWVVTVLERFSYDIDLGNMQAGYVVYASSVSVAVAPQRKNFYQLRNDVKGLTYTAGGTNTDQAIESARIALIPGARPEVKKVMITVTDGGSNNPELTSAKALLARNDGIVMISVGVGDNIVMAELQLIATGNIDDPTRVMTVSDYKNLNTILDQLSQVIEETASTSLEGESSNSTTELTNCQLGTSLYASQNGVYIGAVGSYDRTGTVAEYNDLSSFPNTLPSGYLNVTELESIVGNSDFLAESYFGYSVASGRLTDINKDWTITSAPRYLSRGLVLIYQENPTVVSFILHPNLTSGYWQLGGYYGQTVLAVDINSDGFDDLLVSAPLFSQKSGYDEGIVFVYMNNASITGAQTWVQNSFQPVILTGDSLPGARFGMSIVSGGDIDKNGYKDIIIGAPSEGATTSQGASGAIYVYFSSANGISGSRMQKIPGRSVSTNFQILASFGSTVQAGADFDANGYPDIAVSAPSSDSVVLLRSRKLISVATTITLSPASIPLIDCATETANACSEVGICITAFYEDAAGRDNFEMVYNLTLDPLIGMDSHKRFFFMESKVATITNKEITVGNTQSCNSYNMQIKTESMGGLNGGGLSVTPQVRLDIDFAKSHKDRIMSGVLSSRSESSKTADWSIKKGCSGSGGRCEHDLVISATFSENPSSTPILLSGESRKFVMNVTIENKGSDHAYFLKVNVTSGNLTFTKVGTQDCITVSESESDSSIGLTVIKFKSSRAVFQDLMRSGDRCEFSMEFNFAKLQEIASEPELDVEGTIYSNAGDESIAFDPVLGNNKFQFKRALQYKSMLALNGISAPETIFFNQTTDNPGSATVTSLEDEAFGGASTNYVHNYSISNRGPLGLANSRLKLSWPEKTKNGLFLMYLVDLKCKPESACSCQTQGITNKLNIAPKPAAFGSYVKEYEFNYSTPQDAFISSDPVSCSDYDCEQAYCDIAFFPAYTTISFLAGFKPWIPTFGKEFSAVQISSSAELLLPASSFGTVTTQKQITTTLATIDPSEPPPTPTSSELNIGAIIGGILAGLILLLIIVVVLWKTGFFKSKYKTMTRDARRTIRESQRRGEGMEEDAGPGPSDPQIGKSTQDLCD